MDMALEHLNIVHIVRQHHHAARRIHHIVIEILAKPVPKLDGVVINAGRLVIKIVRANNGGVAPGVAAAKPPLFQDRHIGDAVLLGQIIGRRQPMPARTDDDHIV